MNDLSARALVTVEQARRYVFRDENDGGRDDILIDAVNLVSESIWDHCKREFKETGTGQARIFLIGKTGWIDLSPYELRTLTSVVRYSDREGSLQETLTAEQYRLYPSAKTGQGTYLTLHIPVPRLVESEPGFGWQATVTGDWGMSTVPEPVKFACLQWVKNIVENPGSYASVEMAGFAITPAQDFGTPTTPAGMPPAVRHRLKSYTRTQVIY